MKFSYRALSLQVKTCFEPCNRRVEFIGQVVYPRVLRLKLGVCGTRFET